jgi:hypothetical protein
VTRCPITNSERSDVAVISIVSSILRLQGLFATSSAGGGAGADYTCRGTTSPLRTLLQSANPSAWWQLRRVLAEFRPEVVHVRLFLTQLSPLILPVLRRVPSLYHAAW